MNLEKIVGTYDEIGTWKDSDGNSGELTGNIQEIGYRGQRLSFYFSDGDEVQKSDAIETFDYPIQIQGRYGEGTLLIG